MTTAYTSLLGLALPVTGELSGTWGDVVNQQITGLLDSAVAGTTTLSTDGDVILTTTDGASNQARQAILLCSGARTAARNITAPAHSKIYTVINATTGGYAVVIRGSGPTTGVTIPAGQTATVAWNGSDFVTSGTLLSGNLLFTPDGTYDIGASGANRPRIIYTAGNVQINKTADPLFLAIGNGNSSAGLASSLDNASNYWFAGTRKDIVGGSSGTERWNLLYGSTNILYSDTSGNLGLRVVPKGWASSSVPIQLGDVASVSGDSNSSYISTNYYQATGQTRYITASNYAGMYTQDQTGATGIHKWYIAPNTGTADGALSWSLPMYIGISGIVNIQSTALNPATQIQLKNTTGTTKNNQILFSDSTNVRWRIGTDISTNNNTNNFQLYNEGSALSALTVDSSNRFLFGTGFTSNITSGVVQAIAADTGTTFRSNPAIFSALNGTTGKEVPGLYISDGTNTSLISQVSGTLGIYQGENQSLTLYKTGSYSFLGLQGAGSSPGSPIQISGAGNYGADTNSSYIGAAANGETLGLYGVTGNYAMRYWLDSTTATYYWQSTSTTGTKGASASLASVMALNRTGLLIGTTNSGIGQKLLVVGEGASSSADQGTTLKVGVDNASVGSNVSMQGIFCATTASSGYRFMQMNSGTNSTGTFGDAEFVFYGNGNANADGTWNNNGADYAEFFESATGQEFPVGTTVVLQGNKVRPATSQDDAESIMGVVRPKADGTASMVIGNTAWNKWSKKYLQDDFGVFEQESYAVVEWTENLTHGNGNDVEKKFHSYEEDRIPEGVQVPEGAVRKTVNDSGEPLLRRKLNPLWSPDTEYVPRADRPEWMIIGLIGQIPALANQPVNPRWIKMREISASVFEYFVR